MGNLSKALERDLKPIFTKHPTRVHEAAESAEARLNELEDRDRRRARRNSDREDRLTAKYPNAGA